MTLLQSCCRCFSLRTGTIIIGALGVIWSIISFILIFIPNVKLRFIDSDIISPLATKIILVFNTVFLLLISILLIVGAVQKRVWFMIPWIVLTILNALGMFISTIYTAAVHYSSEEKNKALYATLVLLIGFAIVALTVYLWLVGLSYFLVLRRKKKSPGY